MTSEGTQNRLDARIERFVDRKMEIFLQELLRVRAEANAANALHSSRRLINENSAVQELFENTLTEMAWLIFQCAGNELSEIALFEEKANLLETKIIAKMKSSRAKERGEGERLQAQLESQLEKRIQDASFDFEKGIAGGQVLKKGHDVNVTNIMSQSPGGIQQGGVGNIAETTNADLYRQLGDELNRIRNASELKDLVPDQKHEILDMLATVNDEVDKPAPDASKIQRWGVRLGAKLEEFGMSASASALGSIIASLISGG